MHISLQSCLPYSVCRVVSVVQCTWPNHITSDVQSNQCKTCMPYIGAMYSEQSKPFTLRRTLYDVHCTL